MKTIWSATLRLGICATLLCAQSAFAEPNDNGLLIPAVYPIENAWNAQHYNFSTSTPVNTYQGELTDADKMMLLGQGSSRIAEITDTKPDKDKEDAVDGILKHVPYNESLKYTWDVIDGDVDLYVENLRLDRRNKGLSYKTNDMPLFGESKNLEFKAAAGQDNKISLRYKKTFP